MNSYSIHPSAYYHKVEVPVHPSFPLSIYLHLIYFIDPLELENHYGCLTSFIADDRKKEEIFIVFPPPARQTPQSTSLKQEPSAGPSVFRLTDNLASPKRRSKPFLPLKPYVHPALLPLHDIVINQRCSDLVASW